MTANLIISDYCSLIKDFNKPKYVYERDDVLNHSELHDLAKFNTEIIWGILKESKHVSSIKV